jgi:hypothetical protein
MTSDEREALRLHCPVLVSPRPWSWRGYDDGEAYLALTDARGRELGFVWVAVEDPKGLAEVLRKTPSFVARPRIELEQNLHAICAAVNGTPFEIAPASPTPWRVIKGRGWKDERVLSIVTPQTAATTVELGTTHDDEVLCWADDSQARVDFTAIVTLVNTRWPREAWKP